MQQPHKFDPSAPPIAKRRCPKCGLPMFLSKIEPTEKVDHDERTFECLKCAYAETVIVQSDKAANTGSRKPRGPRHGYEALATLPGSRLDYEHGTLHRHVAGAVQRPMELSPLQLMSAFGGDILNDVDR